MAVGLDLDVRNKRLTCADAKQTDMVEYLASLGYEPAMICNNDYWYHSPLRNERTASFKINRSVNCWYDHGLGKGGNLVDFGIMYHRCSISKFLQSLNGNLSFHRQTFSDTNHKQLKTKKQIEITSAKTLSSAFLFHYIRQRKIPVAIALKFYKEIHFIMHDKQYYAIGFKNDSGGYELRNSFFKASTAPKDITTIKNGSAIVEVFEGFFDFLSFVFVQQNQVGNKSDYLILNSVSFFKKARHFMEQHETINLYLDNDATRQNYSRYALSLNKRYHNKNSLYKSYKDLNEWLMLFGIRSNNETK
jgi:hypothetical protein